MDAKRLNAEQARLAEQREGRARWNLWGPYLAERQWGTVREDYSAGGNAWDALPHDHARSRAYRWGEDGLLGLCDEQGLLCFALALWNGRDAILKERLFGLTNSEGNHGEDVKELYYYQDATPSHAYLRALYKYPQRAFPYAELVRENQRRDRDAPEYELIDSEALCDDRYFDVTIEYAKASPLANYAASKGGVMLLMKTLAQELAPHRIRVNSVCPGAIRTPINRSAWETPEAYGSLLKLIPIGRIGEPDDIGRAVSWLVSDDADYVTGLNLYVDGGMTLYPGFEAGG